MHMLGLFASIFLAIALLTAEIKWGPDYQKTFSRLVARKRSSIIYYFIVFSLFLIAFSIFMAEWFTPHFNLPPVFTAFYAIGVLTQSICIIVPEVGGSKATVHIAAAGVMSASVLAQTALITLLLPLKPIEYIVAILSICIMLVSWVGYAFRLRFTRYELAVQSLYFAGYLATIMAVSFA